MAYATVEEFEDWLGSDPAPPHPARLLDRAARVIDRYLVGAVYDVDDEGAPTQTAVINALKEASFYQALHIADDPKGTKATYSSMSTGSTSWTRGQRKNGSPLINGLAPGAVEFLSAPGLFSWGVAR